MQAIRQMQMLGYHYIYNLAHIKTLFCPSSHLPSSLLTTWTFMAHWSIVQVISSILGFSGFILLQWEEFQAENKWVYWRLANPSIYVMATMTYFYSDIYSQQALAPRWGPGLLDFRELCQALYHHAASRQFIIWLLYTNVYKWVIHLKPSCSQSVS